MTNKNARKNLPPGPGPGRAPGVPNKITTDVRKMILQALENAGGADYLTMQAVLNPSVFCRLVGQTLPLKIQGDPDHPLEINVIQRTIVRPEQAKNDPPLRVQLTLKK